jgi:DNA-binding NarL/FixJ family response regulator
MNGIDVCRKLRRWRKDLAILVLTMHTDDEYVAEAMRSGARGYLPKESACEQLIQAIRTVAEGKTYLAPGISPDVLQRAKSADEARPFRLLTPRERQILQKIAEGKSNRVVAEEFGLSVKTVDTHRWRLMKKLGIHDQTTLVKYAIRNGLVRLV